MAGSRPRMKQRACQGSRKGKKIMLPGSGSTSVRRIGCLDASPTPFVRVPTTTGILVIETASVLDDGRRPTWLSIIAGRIATAVRGCELLVPPTSAHGHQELDRVLVALRLRANIAELRLLKLPLGI